MTLIVTFREYQPTSNCTKDPVYRHIFFLNLPFKYISTLEHILNLIMEKRSFLSPLQ